jgi:predicted amidophosphoribosyltransferase
MIFLIPLGLFLAMAAVLIVSLRTGRALEPRTACTRCGYDLRGLPVDALACPECGTPMSDARYAREPLDWHTFAALVVVLAIAAALSAATIISMFFFPD